MRVVREHENGMVVRRVVPPPAPPVFVCPLPANRAEHVAAHDRRAESFIPTLGELIVEPRLAALLSGHSAPHFCCEHPVVDILAAPAERLFAGLVRAGAVAIQGDGEVMDSELRHTDSSVGGSLHLCTMNEQEARHMAGLLRIALAPVFYSGLASAPGATFAAVAPRARWPV